MPAGSQRLQYLPRELYYPPGVKYRLTGGVLRKGETVEMTSLMREGMIYADGAHLRFPFPFGDIIQIHISEHPLLAVSL